MSTHYIQQLKAESARQLTNTKPSDDAAARDRMSPLHIRLARLLDRLPDETKRGGLSLVTLAGMLRGRRGKGCSPGELGTALRGLGWTRERRWRGGEDGGFSALWRPPGSA